MPSGLLVSSYCSNASGICDRVLKACKESQVPSEPRVRWDPRERWDCLDQEVMSVTPAHRERREYQVRVLPKHVIDYHAVNCG